MSVTHRRAPRALVVLVALAWLTLVPTVAADAELTATFPQAGSSVETSIRTVAARFSQPLGAESSLELVGPGGDIVARGGIDPDDPRRVIVRLDSALPAGAYEAQYLVFSADGHLVRGTFGFTVVPPSPTTALPSPEATAVPTDAVPSADGGPSATPATSPAPEPTEIPLPSPSPTPSPASGSDVLIPIVAAVVIVGGLGLYLLRGRR